MSSLALETEMISESITFRFRSRSKVKGNSQSVKV